MTAAEPCAAYSAIRPRSTPGPAARVYESGCPRKREVPAKIRDLITLGRLQQLLAGWSVHAYLAMHVLGRDAGQLLGQIVFPHRPDNDLPTPDDHINKRVLGQPALLDNGVWYPERQTVAPFDDFGLHTYSHVIADLANHDEKNRLPSAKPAIHNQRPVRISARSKWTENAFPPLPNATPRFWSCPSSGPRPRVRPTLTCRVSSSRVKAYSESSSA